MDSPITSKTIHVYIAGLCIAVAACGGGDDGGASPDGGQAQDAAVGVGDGGATDGNADLPDATMCNPDEFIECSDDTAVYCNSAGTGLVTEECMGYGCNATEMRCNACTPSATECHADELVTCDADGTVADSSMCDAGCDASTATCFTLVPSNLPDTVCDSPGVTNLRPEAGETVVIDTSSNAACDLVADQQDGPGVCVQLYGIVEIPDTAEIIVTGDRPLALVGTDVFTIDGLIDASANGAAAGAGSDDAGVGGAGGLREGGGGGGHATDGDEGGTPTQASGGGGAAGPTTGTAELVPLVGGSRGGIGVGAGAVATSAGGGGGGAVQLVSCTTMTIRPTAVIDVGGGGGAGGAGTQVVEAAGGGGGGSGGAVLIEAGMVTISGTVVGNGGGGGGGGAAGAVAVGPSGEAGEDAPRAMAQAIGGQGGVNASGDGGAGGTDTAPGAGAGALDTTSGSGGAGGASGRIRINVRPNATAEMASSVMSPVATTGEIGQK